MICGMVPELLLCCLAFAGGFCAADRLQALGASRAGAHSFAEHRSYGGVTRHCPSSGGLLLMMAVAFGVLPFSVFNAQCLGWAALVMAVAAFAMMRERAATLLTRREARIVLIGLALVVSDCALVFLPLIALACERFWSALEAQDRVAGIPASLYAPPLAGAGAFLVFQEMNCVGLFGLVTAGGLLGVHALHRFPPQLVCGRSGLLILAVMQAMILAALVEAGAWLAIGTLWSFPLVGMVHGVLRPSNGFEIARGRGEPETGLACAAGSLACANAVLVWATIAQPLGIRFAAFGLSLFLAWHFHRFLVRVPSQGRILSPPASSSLLHRMIAAPKVAP